MTLEILYPISAIFLMMAQPLHNTKLGKILEDHLRKQHEDLRKIYYPFFDTLRYFIDEIEQLANPESWEQYFKSGRKGSPEKDRLASKLISIFEAHGLAHSKTEDGSLDRLLLYYSKLAGSSPEEQFTAAHYLKKR